MPRWLIPVIAGGVLLVVLVVVLLVWALGGDRPSSRPPTKLAALGEPCGADPASACDKGLLCAPGVQKCLLASGASCKQAQANLCASGECDGKNEICAIPLGGACVPDDKGSAPCAGGAVCDPTTRTCVKDVKIPEPRCTAGVKQCSPEKTGIRTCRSDGTWKTEPCPASAALCLDGKCQCSPKKGTACNCGGTVRCDGSCSAPACTGTCTNGRCCVFSTDPACGPGKATARKKDFNSYILKAIELLYQSYRGLGYDLNSAYTHNLDYSKPGEIKAAPRPPKTMCVAAVSEVIITALKLYADETGDRSVFEKLPAKSWMGGTPLDIRPYMFLYSNVESSGTADALQHFGIGERRSFPLLVPGDFIGFNRDNKSGHAVVFMGYLNDKGEILNTYDSKKVVGFKYFSAQGSQPPTWGLGYRWAFFGKCPAWQEQGKPRDCGVIASDNPRFLNTGYMTHPSLWSTAKAMRMLKSTLVGQNSLKILTLKLKRPPTVIDMDRLTPDDHKKLEDEATRALTVELPPILRIKFDGKTTDD